MFSKALAFIKRDFYMQTSYKLHFILQFGSMFANLATFYFISKLVNGSTGKYLGQFGGDYFSFVLVGIAFSGYLTVSLHSFAGNIRNEQLMGTLESILVSPTKVWIVIVSSSLWNFAFASLTVILYLTAGVFLGVDLSSANVLGAFLVLVLTVIVTSSIGILSASFVMIFKKGNPIAALISLMSSLLGGVYFPIELFPEKIRILSGFIPVTYTLRALRFALLKGYPVSYFYLDLLALLLFTVILVPAGIMFFNFAVKKAKIDGSLTYY